ncbi:putative protein (plasmid) [Aquifex aeolicus VF5]|uniref:Uncharacterized protein aq_aa24 n=1 Tax=Aquifex aeolicus (strain VF5) TaxID=224324 RepID=YZ24_AQUAE|nr:RecName: Full=Uncharacterized protein aq_aa24 [Aquifex aeolicus VF5]AAC07967.1 putative protein [Aquifex aeolicus VF5]
MWIACNLKGVPTFVWLSAKKSSHVAKLVLYNSKGYVFVTDKGPWYRKACRELNCGWIHETFGGRNVVERWFKHIKQRMKGFHKRFPHNAKYETVGLDLPLLFSLDHSTPLTLNLAISKFWK